MKKMLKRIASLALAIVMLLSVSVVGMAAGAAEVSVKGDGAAVAGESERFTVSIANNPGISGFNLEYQVRDAYGNDVTGLFTHNKSGWTAPVPNGALFVVDPLFGTAGLAGSYSTVTETLNWNYSANITANGDMCIMLLTLDAGLVSGDYYISLKRVGDLAKNFCDETKQGVDVTFPEYKFTVDGVDVVPTVSIPENNGSTSDFYYVYSEQAPEVKATITNADSLTVKNFTYQWFMREGAGEFAPVAGATGATFVPSDLDANLDGEMYEIYCKVTNTYNGKDYTVNSNVVTLKVDAFFLSKNNVVLEFKEPTYSGELDWPGYTKFEVNGVNFVGNPEVKALSYNNGKADVNTDPANPYLFIVAPVAGNRNYFGQVEFAWNYLPATIGNVADKAVTVYKGGAPVSIVPAPSVKAGNQVEVTYAITEGSDLIDLVDGKISVKNTVNLAVGETKKAEVQISIKSEPNYKPAVQTVEVTVAGLKKANVALTPALGAQTYDKNTSYDVESLFGVKVTADETGNTLSGGNVSYAVTKNGATVTEIKDAGTYMITATYVDAYYSGTSAAAEFVIAPKPVDVTDLDWDYTSAFQYDEQAHTVELKTVPEGLTVAGYTGNTGTDAKGYTASVTFNADSNHVVSGTPETLSWEISKRSVDVSGLAWQSETSFEYNKTEHSVVLVDPVDPWVVKAIKQIKYTDNAKTNAGTYTAKAELVANDNYVLTGTMPTPKSWTISTVKVTVPTAQNYTFASGQERMGLAVNDSDAYTVSGVNTATDAGTYNLTVTLKDTANYEWATSFDGKLTWTIAEAAFPKTTHDTSVRYDADKLEIDLNDLFPGYKSVVSSTVTNNMTAQIAGVEVKDGKLVIDVKPELPRPEVGQEPKGTIVLKIDTANYAEGTLTINLMVSSKVDVSSKIAFDLSNVKLTYNGKNQIDAVKTAAVKDAALKGTITYSISEAVNAGNYTIIATYEDADNYGTATQTFTIEQKDITITGGTVAAQEYDGDVTVDSLTDAVVTGTVEGESLTAGTDYEITNIKFANANVGTGKAVSYTVALKDTAKAKNYKLTAATGATTGAVTAKSVTVTVADIAAVTYTGVEQYPTVVASATGTVNGYQLGSDDMVITYVNNKNAGTATVKVNPKAGSNYTFAEVTKNFTINKAQLAVSSVTVADKEYDGTNSAVVDSVTFTGLVNNESLGKGTDYSVTATFTGVNAGTGTATYTVALTDTAKAANYEITAGATGNTTANINQLQPQPKPVESLPAEEKITGETTLAKALDAVFGDVIDMLGGGSAAVKDKDGNVMTAEQMAETKVEANKEYEWIFTPAEKDKINVASTSGKITLYPQNAQAAAGGIVTVLPTTNGTVGVNTVYATMGTKVTVNVLPSAGYELSKLEVVSFHGKSIPVVQVADGKFTFVMPETAVTVKATFAKVGGARHSFVDVPAGSWFYTPVYYAYENGLMNGVGDGTRFAPGDNLTRGMLMTILARLDGVDTAGGATWYTKGMEWAKAVGISDGTMPEANITREQAVTMLFRYAQYKGVDVSVGENTNILSYDDAFQISEWAMPAMQWGCGSGMIQGNGGKVNPAGTASRAEIATMLMRFVENVMK